MAFEYWNIRRSDNFGPFEYQTSQIFNVKSQTQDRKSIWTELAGKKTQTSFWNLFII